MKHFYYIITILCFCFQGGYSQIDLTRGLIAYYPFNGNARNAVTDDFHGTLNGDIQATSDRFGNANGAWLFNGANTNIVVKGNAALTTSAFSVCYYFKTNKKGQQVITGKIGYLDGVAAIFNTGVFHEGDNTFFGTLKPMNDCSKQVPATYNYTILSPPVVRLNEWYCVVNTFEEGVQSTYLDGVLVNQENLPFADAALCSNTDFIIGSWWKDDPWWFSGVIDDVRLYDRAITTDEVRALCGLTADSLIINDYAAALDFSICDNELTVDDASRFSAGDTVLLIQMKGAVIDSSNSPSFGTVADYNHVGNYEFNIVKSKTGNRIVLLNVIERTYDFENGKVQLVRVPYYGDVTFSKSLTALPWDGSKGGVLCFNASGRVTLQADMDVSGKGFRHGSALQNRTVTSNATGYFYDAYSNNGGEKGEGIATMMDDKKYGRGALANGGGGGNAHNAGGGGGSNGGSGGNGGDQYEPLKSTTDKIGGRGGNALANDASLNRLFLGGAGGMGQANDLAEFPAGNGGGIIIISARELTGNGFSIKANGENATEAPTPAASKDGMPGGGAGGSVLLNIPTVPGNVVVAAKGGKGADQQANIYNGKAGPGGGGGGGIIAVSQAVVPASYIPTVAGGINGTNTGYLNDPWDARPGNDGRVITNFKIIVASKEFRRNIDSVRISEKLSDCRFADLESLTYVNNSPIKTWQWDFGDGTTSADPSVTNHEYQVEGDFKVRLIATDENGCQDSTVKTIAVFSPDIQMSGDTAICEGNTVKLSVVGAASYKWEPGVGLDNPNIATPVASPKATTTFSVTATKVPYCVITESVTITVNDLPVVKTSADTTVCVGTVANIWAAGGDIYEWTQNPTLGSLNTSTSTASPTQTTTYYVLVTNAAGCTQNDSVRVDVFEPQKIQIVAEPEICKNTSIGLSATGGVNFAWYPADLVADPSAQTTQTTSLSTDTTFRVVIQDNHSCTYNDSVRITIRPEAVFSISADTAVCKNDKAFIYASGGDHYEWSPSVLIGNSFESSAYVSPGNTTNFNVVISEDKCGKRETLSTTVRVMALPSLKVSKSNDISCAAPFSTLSAASTAVRFAWSPEATIDRADVRNPVVSPKNNTMYVVAATDMNGCKNTDSIFVKVDFSDNPFVGLPTAFTPNGDGLNDCFSVASHANVSDLDFTIFNRYGQAIFHTTNPKDCWDGRFKGEPQNSGVYVYIVKAKTACTDIYLKGQIVLIR